MHNNKFNSFNKLWKFFVKIKASYLDLKYRILIFILTHLPLVESVIINAYGFLVTSFMTYQANPELQQIVIGDFTLPITSWTSYLTAQLIIYSCIALVLAFVGGLLMFLWLKHQDSRHPNLFLVVFGLVSWFLTLLIFPEMSIAYATGDPVEGVGEGTTTLNESKIVSTDTAESKVSPKLKRLTHSELASAETAKIAAFDLIEDLKHNRSDDFKQKAPSLAPQLGAILTTNGKTGFEGKLLLHVLNYLIENPELKFAFFSSDIIQKEGIPVLGSQNICAAYFNAEADAPLVLVPQQNSPNWLLIPNPKYNKLSVELSPEISMFLSQDLASPSPLFLQNTSIHLKGSQLYYHKFLSIGDLIFQNIYTQELVFVESKTQPLQRFLSDPNLKHMTHLEKQLLVFNKQQFFHQKPFSNDLIKGSYAFDNLSDLNSSKISKHLQELIHARLLHAKNMQHHPEIKISTTLQFLSVFKRLK